MPRAFIYIAILIFKSCIERPADYMQLIMPVAGDSTSSQHFSSALRKLAEMNRFLGEGRADCFSRKFENHGIFATKGETDDRSLIFQPLINKLVSFSLWNPTRFSTTQHYINKKT